MKPILKPYAVPTVLAAIMLTGLVLALIDEGAMDWLASGLVAAPLVILLLAHRRRSGSPAP